MNVADFAYPTWYNELAKNTLDDRKDLLSEIDQNVTAAGRKIAKLYENKYAPGLSQRTLIKWADMCEHNPLKLGELILGFVTEAEDVKKLSDWWHEEGLALEQDAERQLGL